MRFATPSVVAEYRAKRLRCKTLADISCGIGGQTIFFARECDFVYAVEIDPKKIEYARKNCKRYGLDNVEFICGNALSQEVIAKVPAVDIIFSDPSRPSKEDIRKVTSLEPAIPNVISAYSDKTPNFAFEAPPQMPPERISFDCEREYLSLNGQLNRLTLYFGNLKQCERSAVSLPASSRISTTDTSCTVRETTFMGSYAYEPEPSVIKAQLIPQLTKSLEYHTNQVGLFTIDKKRMLLTSDSFFRHPMVKNHYAILLISVFNVHNINSFLKNHDAGTVILRAGIDPADYWSVRKNLESGLNGKKTIHLFVNNDLAIVCEVL
ncbi:MAG: class I SAM-dependent methyltransferase [Methanosarcinaceae archaeon]|nr:class I SAM-dependent methyltransferase [Methanosarcinaceae archaeon]